MSKDENTPETKTNDMDARNRRTVVMCLSIFSVMLGLSFAAVPLYDLFCRVTGFGGTPMIVEIAPENSSERTIRVRFDANVNGGLGWSFKPEVNEVRVRLGEVMVINYIAQNLTARTTTGTSTFNVTPTQTGQFFSKIQCFCFQEQTLEPGESVKMPVQFFVDPRLAEHADAQGVGTITLSYTFFEVRNPQGLTLSSANGN